MSDEEYLRQCMDLCSVEEIDHGHKAVFMGHPAIFRSSEGPNEWTRDMACKSALFFCALEKTKEDIQTIIL